MPAGGSPQTPIPGGEPGRKRGLIAFALRHPRFTGGIFLALVLLVVADVWLLGRRERYEQEILLLRAGMTEFERDRADALTSAEQRRLSMMVEMVRQQARGDQELHLAVAVDSGVMHLRRAGALLRDIPVEVGPPRQAREPADTALVVPVGRRSVVGVLEGLDSWEVPEWVYRDKGLPVPADRHVPGGLGPAALLLDGGTVIYSPPLRGPLADSAYILPGSLRAAAADLRAILANLRGGASVYFY